MRQGLKWAIQWIADNDSVGDDDSVDILEGFVSVALVADMFDKPQLDIANRVYKLRHPDSEDGQDG
jgi:hypothetical protein